MTHSPRRQLWRSMAGLPHWVKLWLIVLVATNLASVWFLDSPVGRWTLVTFGVIGLFNLPMVWIQNGLTRLLSFPHLLWFGLLWYLATRLWGPEPLAPGPWRSYAMLVVAVNAVSLVFDVLECARWLGGAKQVLGLRNPRLG